MFWLYYAIGAFLVVVTVRTEWWRDMRRECVGVSDESLPWFMLAFVLLGWPVVYLVVGLKRFVNWYALPVEPEVPCSD